MKKNILIGIFLIVLFSTAFVQYKTTSIKEKTIPILRVSVKQTVPVDGKKTQSTLSPKKGTTALQLLSASHKIMTKGEKENTYITEIDGRAAADTSREFWAFYVNGEQAQVGAGSYLVKNNDTIEWKIEMY